MRAGRTAVNGGAPEEEGALAPSTLTTVNSGGTLTGIGTVGNLTVAGGGTFAPGSGAPGSSMTVAGNLAFQSGMSYGVDLPDLFRQAAAVDPIGVAKAPLKIDLNIAADGPAEFLESLPERRGAELSCRIVLGI